MAYADTHITEAQAPDVDGHEFDEVWLANETVGLGAKVWFAPKMLAAVGAAGVTQPGPTRRLIVHIEDEPNAHAAIQRVRTALQWNGPMSECPF